MEKNIVKQLKTDYEELEIKPSAGLWDQIEIGLDSPSETLGKTKFQWLKYAAVIVFLMTFGGFLFFNTDKSPDIRKTVVVEKSTKNIQKRTEIVKTIASNEQIIEDHMFYEAAVTNIKENSTLEKSSGEIMISKNLTTAENKNTTIEIPEILPEKIEIPITKSVVAERKKTFYINAEDLLLGRELDKTREETQNHKQFGVLDLSKIKIKRPNSLQILGFTVYSDSLRVE